MIIICTFNSSQCYFSLLLHKTLGNLEQLGSVNMITLCVTINTHIHIYIFWASQVVPVVKNPPASAGDIRDVGSIPGSGKLPGGGA